MANDTDKDMRELSDEMLKMSEELRKLAEQIRKEGVTPELKVRIAQLREVGELAVEQGTTVVEKYALLNLMEELKNERERKRYPWWLIASLAVAAAAALAYDIWLLFK